MPREYWRFELPAGDTGANAKLTIVRPSLSELDNNYQKSGKWKGIWKVAESGQLFMCDTLGTFNEGRSGDAGVARLEFLFSVR